MQTITTIVTTLNGQEEVYQRRKYYSCLEFTPIKKRKGQYIHKEALNNIPHFIKNCLCINCLQVGFVMYNDKLIILKREVITDINDSMIPVNFCQNNNNVINFTTDDMI